MWKDKVWQKIRETIDEASSEMIKLQSELVALPAIGPQNGGQGEVDKANYLLKYLNDLSLNVKEYNAPDDSVPSGYRPNLVVRLEGINRNRTIWIMTHLDIVPPGPKDLWQTDPFQAVVKDGKIFGRGTEDNQQEMVASIIAVKVLKSLGLAPNYDVALLLVADEETGSKFGAQYLVNNHPELFKKDDLFIVADAGNEDGTLLEIAEKSMLWLKFIVYGKQCHASAPHHGINAHRIGANLICHLDKYFKKKYKVKNRLFSPPTSTFEPTKKESNVPNINTIPGEDVFYFDCRILPEYDLQNILTDIREELNKIENKFSAKIVVEPFQSNQSAPMTPSNSDVVKLLKQAIKKVYNVNAKPRGIGGGTVAAILRKQGFPAVVWGKFANTAHQPNEYCIIENMIGDAKVYAYLFGMEA
ncbi:MAG: M20 family metallo-hydrolase [candidate division WOR-3 bacterium]|nr:M20 family metallo-hydrolase [candidate division WOR-3 bacterium]